MNLQPRLDHSLLIFLAGLFLFNSPLRQWWSELSMPWYAIYLAWLVIILLVALNQYWQHRGD